MSRGRRARRPLLGVHAPADVHLRATGPWSRWTGPVQPVPHSGRPAVLPCHAEPDVRGWLAIPALHRSKEELYLSPATDGPLMWINAEDYISRSSGRHAVGGPSDTSESAMQGCLAWLGRTSCQTMRCRPRETSHPAL